MPFQENSILLESTSSHKTTYFQNTERTLKLNGMRSLEFLTLLEFKYPHTTDLETRKIPLVMSTDLSQRNQSETFSNMLIMMERFFDLLQDLILKFLKM